MKRLALILVISTFSIMFLAVSAPAQDSLYLTEPTVVDMSKVLPRYDAALWNMDFRDNPALLSLDCPYEFISDIYYLGGYRHISSGAFGQLNFPLAALRGGTFSTRSSEMDYYAHGLGADVGFALKLNDRANLAAIFGYRWDHVSGEGDFTDFWQRPGILPASGIFNGSREDNYNAHTFAVSLLLSSVLTDKVTFGAGLKYSYTFDKYRSEMEGFGERFGRLTGTETASTDDELALRYHRIAPVLGISLKPSAMFKLDASVETGFYLGGVSKDTSLFEAFTFPITLRPPTTSYTEDFDSSDLSGWDITAKVNPEFVVSDKLSIPIAIGFRHRDFRWGVDGVSEGMFIPWNYLEVSLDNGFVDYENDMKSWDITGEAGVKYLAGWGTLSGLAAYTHRDVRSTYKIDDQSGTPDEFVAYSQWDKETRDIISLGVVFEKEFSPMLNADLGIRYDLGWGFREIHTNLASELETGETPPPLLMVEADGRDIYQDLTLTTHLTLKPMDHLSIALGGMVKIPLDNLDYDMDGASTGLEGLFSAPRPGYLFNGPFSMEYESTGWDWGGLLSVTYEFGCPVAAPLVTPEPVIEPKLEPMSFK